MVIRVFGRREVDLRNFVRAGGVLPCRLKGVNGRLVAEHWGSGGGPLGVYVGSAMRPGVAWQRPSATSEAMRRSAV